MFDSSVGPNDNGYVITYTVDDSANCVTDGTSDTTTFTITVNEPQAANAGEIADQTVCSDSGMINLADFLTANSSTGGTFSGEGVENNMFDASMEAGDYLITYSVTDTAPCVIEGTESPTY